MSVLSQSEYCFSKPAVWFKWRISSDVKRSCVNFGKIEEENIQVFVNLLNLEGKRSLKGTKIIQEKVDEIKLLKTILIFFTLLILLKMLSHLFQKNALVQLFSYHPSN